MFRQSSSAAWPRNMRSQAAGGATGCRRATIAVAASISASRASSGLLFASSQSHVLFHGLLSQTATEAVAIVGDRSEGQCAEGHSP